MENIVSLSQLNTEQGIYSPATIYVSDEVVTSVIFPELKFDLNDILPNN